MTANNGNRLHVDMMLSSSILLNIVHNIEEEVSSTFGCTDIQTVIYQKQLLLTSTLLNLVLSARYLKSVTQTMQLTQTKFRYCQLCMFGME